MLRVEGSGRRRIGRSGRLEQVWVGSKMCANDPDGLPEDSQVLVLFFRRCHAPSSDSKPAPEAPQGWLQAGEKQE